MDLTKVEKIGDIWVKREDTFVCGGANGGKARVIDSIVRNNKKNGCDTFVTCGSRDSRQCEALALITDYYGCKCHIFMPSGKDTSITTKIESINNATLHRTKVGYNNVLISYAKKFAEETRTCYIPFALQCEDSINVNMHQVKNVPKEAKRIIVPVGGGMNMISIIRGLIHYGIDKEVVGVMVGKEPYDSFNTFLPKIFFNYNYSFVRSELGYSKHATNTIWNGIELDGVYEAKCLPFLKEYDLFWIVGKESA